MRGRWLFRWLFWGLIPIIMTPFGNAAPGERSLEELRADLKKIEASIEATREQLRTIRDARFLPDIYFALAEFHVDKSKYMFAIKLEENKGTPQSELDFTLEGRPKRQAIEIYQNFLDKFPSHPDRDRAYFFMAHEYRELGDLEPMMKTYIRMIKEYPNSRFWEEAHIVLGDYFLDIKKDTELALENYQKVLKRQAGPFTPLAHYKSGGCYILLEKFWDAMLSFEKVLTEGAKVDTSTLPELYRKTDVAAEALVSVVRPYSEIKQAELQKSGAWRTNPVQYLYTLSNNEINFQKALKRMGQRLKIKNRLVEATRVYMELLRLNRDLETRLDAIEQVYENMKNSQKSWPVRGYTDEIAKTIAQIRYSEKLNDAEKKKDITNFEVFLRDAATRQHERAKQTQQESDYRLALNDYKNYLWAFPRTKYTRSIQLNMAETNFHLKEYVEAGKYYEIVALATRDKNRRYQYFKPTAESYTLALKQPGKLDRTQLAQARYGLRDTAQQFIRHYPRDAAVPMLSFNVGQTYFDERRFDRAVAAFKSFIKAYPNHENLSLAANQILDALNQKEDFAGIIREGKAIIANAQIRNEGLKNDISEIVRQAEMREVQMKAGDFSSPEYAQKLLKFAQKNKGTTLGDSALYEAFTALKSKRDPRAYEPGEQLLEAHGNSRYAKEVVHEMGKMALATADYRRAATYFETFALKYPKDPESKDLILNAGKIREMSGDYEQAIKDFRFLGDNEGVARAMFRQQNWQALEGAARKTSGLKSVYWQGIALTRMDNFAAARPLLQRASSGSPSSPEEQEMAAHALFLLSAEALSKFERIQMVAGQEQKSVADKKSQLNAVTNQLKKVIAYGNGRWTIAALYSLGRANKEMTDFILNVPLPDGLSSAQVQQVKQQLKQNAEPYRKIADDFYKQCVNSAEKYEVFTLFAVGCVSKGAKEVREDDELRPVKSSVSGDPRGVEDLRKRLYDEPRNAKLLNELAGHYLKAGDHSMGIVLYQRSLEVEPNNADTLALLGMAHIFANNLQEAGQTFLKALKTQANQATALWGLVGLYNEFQFKAKYRSFLNKAKSAGRPQGPIPSLVQKVL